MSSTLSLIFQLQDIGENAIQTELYLHRVKEESFRRYTLVAENSVAVTTAEVQLMRGVYL